MGFFKSVKVKAWNGCGEADDPDYLMKALEECWDEISAAVNALEGDERDQFMEEINAIAPDNAMTPFEMLCGSWRTIIFFFIGNPNKLNPITLGIKSIQLCLSLSQSNHMLVRGPASWLLVLDCLIVCLI